MRYRQLTLDERYQIQALWKQHNSYADIARELKRAASTIWREIRRNGWRRDLVPVYTAFSAHDTARDRRVQKGATSRKIRGRLKVLVEQKLRLSWSPEQISGRLRRERGIRLSHETIYQHVLRDTKQHGLLRYCLRFAGYKHHRFKKSKVGERTRLRKNWLDTRPAGANNRSELGHWERDSLEGTKGTSVLLTLVDRKSRLVCIRHVHRKDCKAVARATVAALEPFGKTTRTVTNDNGHEFRRDESLQKRLGVKIFFTDPSSPWQRGSIENVNGLLRQYLPKGCSFDNLPPWTPSALEETLNHRPRKILGYKTPYEVFFDENVPLTNLRLMRFGLEFSVNI